MIGDLLGSLDFSESFSNTSGSPQKQQAKITPASIIGLLQTVLQLGYRLIRKKTHSIQPMHLVSNSQLHI